MAVDMFLKISGIDGESTDHKHKDEIEVFSWSWGVSQTGSTGGGGGGAGKAVPGQFILKDLVLLGAAVWSLGEALPHVRS